MDKWRLLSDLKHLTKSCLDKTHKSRDLIMLGMTCTKTTEYLKSLEDQLVDLLGQIEYLIEQEEDDGKVN